MELRGNKKHGIEGEQEEKKMTNQFIRRKAY